MREDESVLDRTAPLATRQLRYGPDRDHVADVYGSGEAPAVVLVHGGFWRPAYDRTHLRPLAAAVAESGSTAVLVEYRREPGRPDESIADVELAVDAVAGDTGHSPVVVGHSAGGHLALLAALRRPSSVRVVVALAAVSDLGAAQALDLGSGAVRDFLGVDAQLRADLDPAQGGPFAVPVVAIHGADDSIVPLRLSHELAARDPACRLVALADTGHFDVIDPEVPQGRVVLAEIAAATRSA